jgi:hypothetical protein
MSFTGRPAAVSTVTTSFAVIQNLNPFMQSALVTLTRRIYTNLSPAVIIKSGGARGWYRSAGQLAEQLEADFIEQYLLCKGHKRKTAVVYAMQGCAVHLADKLQEYTGQLETLPLQPPFRETCAAFYRQLQHCLLQFLEFLQQDFYDYCNPAQRVPAAVYFGMQQRMFAWLTVLQKPGGEHIQLSFLVAKRLRSDWLQGLSYARYGYWCHLRDAWQEPGDRMDLLIRNNFNDEEFVGYAMAAWALEAGADPQGYWRRKATVLNHTFCCETIALTGQKSSCRDMLLSAIKTLTVALRSLPGSAEQGSSLKPIRTNLTLGQLAGLVRLMADTGMLVSANQSMLIKQVADFFDVRNGANYSTESLRQKYYHPDPPALNILRSQLINMMSKLSSY